MADVVTPQQSGRLGPGKPQIHDNAPQEVSPRSADKASTGHPVLSLPAVAGICFPGRLLRKLLPHAKAQRTQRSVFQDFVSLWLFVRMKVFVSQR
jgi:hypothetical protein